MLTLQGEIGWCRRWAVWPEEGGKASMHVSLG